MNNHSINLIQSFLLRIQKELTCFLDNSLSLIDNYWQRFVFPNLSAVQQFNYKNAQSLFELDLSALIRVFDKLCSIPEISRNITWHERNIIKEMATVRNDYAHISCENISFDDIYRNLDTMQRFCQIIQAQSSLIEDLQQAKDDLLQTQKGNINMEQSEFKIGDMVYVNNNFQAAFPIIVIKDDIYTVFKDNQQQQFYKNQLTPFRQPEIKALSYNQFCAYLTALYLNQPKSNTLYSLNSANIDFIPYQFRPVMKLIQSEYPKLLIADDVGVGKTIEAGIILKELQARENIEKVLIICPRPLITEHKWKNEMKRFGEDFDELDSSDFKYCIDYFDENESWSDKHNKIIVPYSLFTQQLLEGEEKKRQKWSRKIGLEQLDPKPQFDLVIVDEAHYIRNADSYRHKVVNFFCENAKAVVFLTATPIQMKNEDLFTLLNVLRPDLISDKFIFDHLTEPNKYINQAVNAMRSQQDNWQETAIAALKEAQNTDYGKSVWIGNPEIQRIQEMLQKSEISRESRIDMIARTEKLHTLSHVINRTRRREIGNFTQRNSQTVESTYTAKQRAFYEKVIDFIAKLMSAAHQNISVRFMMTTLMRQISSSLFALQPFLQDILQNKINQLDYADYEEDIDSKKLNPYTKEIQDIINLSGCLKPADDDKLTQLKAIIRQKQAMPNNKMIVFSTFRHTLNYLHKELQQSGFRVGLINGDTPQEERIDLRKCFEKDKNEDGCLDILLFSEVGCEGLDYQFCDCLVNYDIPWNPMKIEQRIGRIDRKGQKSQKIAIYNLITKETIDADIYERCLNRIGIFESAIGQTDEILGDIVQKIDDIVKDFILTGKEQKAKLEIIADNEIKQQQEKEKLEQDSAQLFGIDLSQEQIKKEVENAHSFWLSPTALVRFIQRYLQERLDESNAILGSENNKIRTMRLSIEKRSLLKEDFDALYQGKVLNLEEKEWREWLKSGEQHFAFAFKGEEKTDDKKTHFISPRHPLIRQAVAFLNTHDSALTKPVSFLKVSSDTVPAGDYPFAVYSWLYQGYRSDFKLKMICENQALTQHLEKLLEQAQDHVSGSLNIDDHIKERLEKQQKALYDAELQDYKKDAEKIIAFKKEQLEKGAERRIAIYKNNIQQAKDEKYKKGEETKINNLQQQTAEKCKELDTQLQQTALNANPIAFGVITIQPQI